jgi:hypothetical protein
MMTSSVCSLRDNARAYNVRAMQQLLQSFSWEVLGNPSYSPDIAPSDLSLFVQGGSNMTGTCAACLHTNQSRSYLNHLVHLKKHVDGQKFHEDEEVKNEVVIACAGGRVL